MSARLRVHVGALCLGLAVFACDDGPASVPDPTPDGAVDVGPDARPLDARVPDSRVVDAAPDVRVVDGASPDAGVADAAPADVGSPDVAPCIFVPPQPDCSPAGRGHPDGVPAAYETVSAGFEGRLDRERVHISGSCWLPYEDLAPVVVVDDPSFFALQRCAGDAMPEPSGVDWATWRLALYPTPESPDTRVRWVVDDGGTLIVGAELPLYCGGPAPTTGLVAVLLPADGRAVAERLAACRTGDGLGCCACEVVCDPEPRRTECECPP